MVDWKDLLPKNVIDGIAMTVTFVFIPFGWLYGVFYITPTLWPVSGVPAELIAKNTGTHYAHVLAMTFLLLNTLVNLFIFMTTDTTCRRVALPVVSQPGWVFCPFCQYYAPPRSHHCTTCKRCVLRRDHHCYFAGKCVGHYNQRYFVAFLIYITIAAVYAIVLSIITIMQLMGGFSITFLPAMIFPVLGWVFGIIPANPIVSLALSVATFGLFGGGGLLTLQIYELSRGQTYYEVMRGTQKFDLGVRANFADALGKNWWFSWILPFIPSPLVGEGSHYSADGHVMSHDPRKNSQAKGTRRKMMKST